MEPKDIRNWLLENFPINRIIGNEANFPCPECSHPAFSFNYQKELGHCFRDSCLYNPTLSALIDIAGTPPQEGGYGSWMETPSKPNEPVSLPITANPVYSPSSYDAWAAQTLWHRNVPPDQIRKFNLHSDQNWIYVPIVEKGTLVQYVARSVDRSQRPEDGFRGTNGRRYDYFPGVSISDYFLGWGECCLWSSLTLVENTFNAIWLRDELSCTTNFGSHLSKSHIDKIIRSRVKKITLLWDHGAELRAEKAERGLTDRGISVKVVHLPWGQPDDFDLSFLREAVDG